MEFGVNLVSSRAAIWIIFFAKVMGEIWVDVGVVVQDFKMRMMLMRMALNTSVCCCGVTVRRSKPCIVYLKRMSNKQIRLVFWFTIWSNSCVMAVSKR